MLRARIRDMLEIERVSWWFIALRVEELPFVFMLLLCTVYK